MKKPLGLRLEESLIARIDAVRGSTSRTAFVEGAIERELGGSPGTVRSPAPGDVMPVRAARHLRAVPSSNAKAGVFPVGWRDTDGTG